MTMPASAPSAAAIDGLQSIRASWGWFVALGVAFVILGLVVLAHEVAATFVVTIYVGALIAVAGVVQMIHAFRVMGWGRFLYWLLAGVLYIVAGGLIMLDPALGALSLTILLGVALAVEGIFRIIAGFGTRPASGWGWIVFSGFVTLLLGALIIAKWPASAFAILGLFLGIDLIVNGVTTAMFGLALRGKKA